MSTSLPNNINGFPLEIRYSKRRRSLALDVNLQRLRVSVPQSISEENIYHFLQEKNAWITSKIKLIQNNTIECDVLDSQQLTLFDCAVPVVIEQQDVLLQQKRKAATIDVIFDDNRLRVTIDSLSTVSKNHIRIAIKRWIRHYANDFLLAKSLNFAEQFGVQFQQVQVKFYKRRWGSCSKQGIISYHANVVRLPEAIIDYVVMHELAHLIHPNHSANYWQQVADWCPDYQTAKTWLKQNGMFYY